MKRFSIDQLVTEKMYEEKDFAEFRCKGCGEWFTEYEMMEKSIVDMPVCKNCGSDEIVKCVGDWSSRECFTCEFVDCPFA